MAENRIDGPVRQVVQASVVHGGVHVHGAAGPPHVADEFPDVFGDLRGLHVTTRPWLRDRVDAFLAGGPRGYFFVEGKTGVGKTTFLAALARERGLPGHFVTGLPSRRTVAGALRGLGTQLISRYGLAHEPETAADPVGFLEVLHAAAGAASREGRRLVLAVDGLDRAAEGADLPLALPTSLPDNAYVIATVREGVPLHARQERHDHVRIDPAGQANLNDVRRHVEQALAADDVLRARVVAKTSAEAFRDEVARRCGGVWIFLRHVLADVREGRTEPDGLAALPVGLWAYYSHTLDQLMAEGDVLPALSVLACAPEPLTLDTVVALTGAPDVADLRALVSGRLRAFATDRDGRFAPLHDSARDYLTGVRPDGAMTGDEPRLDLLATTATATRRRIADRHLAALARDPAALGDLDDGYGLRNLAGHLAELGAAPELHDLLTAPHGGSTAWFRAHEAHGTFADYRASLALGRRLAADATDAELAEGGRARPIGREIRYALMDSSVESIVTGVRPGLLRTLVEGRVWPPGVALARVRAVEHYADRVELVGALARARRDDEPCLDPARAARALALISPPASRRAHEVVALLAPLLAADDRARLVAGLLPADGTPNRADRLVALAPVLAPDELDRAVAEALDLPDPARALAGLVPHLPARALPALRPVVAGYHEPYGFRQIARRALVLRLAAEGLEPAWVASCLAHELRSLSVQAAIGGPEHVRALVPLVDGPTLAAALDDALDHVDQATEPDVPVLSALAEFLRGPAVDRALDLARAVGRIRPVRLRAEPHWARASALAALLRAVPAAHRGAVVAEALRALPKPGDRFDLVRGGTLAALAAHADPKNAGALRAEARRLEPRHRAAVLAALAGRVPPRDATALRREALEQVAAEHGWRRAEALRAVAPHLDHDSRRVALGLLADVDRGRAETLEALVEGVTDEEALEEAAEAVAVIGDARPHVLLPAALVGHVSRAQRPALCARVEVAAADLPPTDRADVLIALAAGVAGEDRERLLRQAAGLAPVARDPSDRGHASRLAALCGAFTTADLHARLADAVTLLDDEDALDTWHTLGARLGDDRVTERFWDAQNRRLRGAPDHRYARFLAMIAPWVDADQVAGLPPAAADLDARYRGLPLAAAATRLTGPARRDAVRVAFADLAADPALTRPHLVALLARAMTADERDRLVDLLGTRVRLRWFPDVLARVLPELDQPQRERLCAAAVPTLPTQAPLPGRDFTAVAAHATVPFLRALLEAARFAPEGNRARATAAVLSAGAAARVSWQREVAGLPPLRELLSGFDRPGLVTVLAAAVPQLVRDGGRRAGEECLRAVDDVMRWWP